MALSQEDWSDLLAHIRRRVRDVGLADLDTRLTLDFRTTDSSRADFLRYFSSLLGAASERSYSGYQKALRTIQDCVRTEDGGHVEGIEVRVTDADYGLYGTPTIDLGALTDLGALSVELERLWRELHESGLVDEQEDAQGENN